MPPRRRIGGDAMRVPARTKRSDPPHAQRAALDNVVDDTRLLRAIQTLDGVDSKAGDASQRLCDALQCFIDLLLLLGDSSGSELPSAARAEIETLWEARVLTCLQRFIQKRKHVTSAAVGACACKGGRCIETLVDYTLLSIAYYLAREPRLAIAVVKTELHALALDVLVDDVNLARGTADNSVVISKMPISSLRSLRASSELALADARDVLLALDPFDWCYRSTCAYLTASSRNSQYDNDDATLFFVPVGLRSLSYLLAGESLPTDEISEHNIAIRRHGSSSHCESPVRGAGRRSHKLPSIFTFPTTAPLATTSSASGANEWQQRLCAQRFEAARRVVSTRAAHQHMALRTVAALLLNLPRTSPERKVLLVLKRHEGMNLSMLLLAHAELSLAQYAHKRVDNRGITSFEMLALEPQVLERMARSAALLLSSADLAMPSVEQQQQRLHHSGADARSSIDTVVTSSSTMRFAPSPGKQSGNAAAVAASLSLADRLGAASDTSSREFAASAHSLLEHEQALQRALRRQQLRTQCEQLEQLRQQLSRSLYILRSGRTHADPRQSFTDWIASLPTVETMANDRRDAARLREQHMIEQQYEREAARKRRLRECALMQQNDYSALDATELTRNEQQRLEFVRMQDEMQELERQQRQYDVDDYDADGDRIDSDGDLVSRIQATMLQQQTLVAQRKQRQRHLDEAQRRKQAVLEHRREAQERDRMGREDLYYVEMLRRRQQRELEQRKQMELLARQQGDPIEAQQRKIECMRQRDAEQRLAEREAERMRTEDLLARQLRYVLSERLRLEVQRERLARKHMDAEERESRARWTLVAQEQQRIEAQEAKRLRVEARKLRQWQQQVRAAWIEAWDASGNVYYYNSVTGASQWESPFVAE